MKIVDVPIFVDLGVAIIDNLEKVKPFSPTMDFEGMKSTFKEFASIEALSLHIPVLKVRVEINNFGLAERSLYLNESNFRRMYARMAESEIAIDSRTLGEILLKRIEISEGRDFFNKNIRPVTLRKKPLVMRGVMRTMDD